MGISTKEHSFACRLIGLAYQWYGDAMFEDELMVLHKNDRKGDNRIKNLKLALGLATLKMPSETE